MTLKNLKIPLLTLIAVAAVLIGGFFVWQKFLKTPEPIYCTQDAKACPDGSYVGRVPPNCEFKECPASAALPIEQKATSSPQLNTVVSDSKTNNDNRTEIKKKPVQPKPITSTGSDPTKNTETKPVTDVPAQITEGNLRGNIWSICPGGDCTNPPTLPRHFILTSVSNAAAQFRININPDGTFEGNLPAGSYKIGYNECSLEKCKHRLWPTLTIESGVTTYMKIENFENIEISQGAP